MHAGKLVFAQLMEHLPLRTFCQCVSPSRSGMPTNMEKQIKKIIGFDSWTGGSRHYQRLLPALDARSIQLTLVHLGSWGNEPGCPHESRMDDLLVRDIAFYAGGSFESVLDIEQPDAVILLSTDTFAHRAFIRYCNQRAIPTLNLFHGVESMFGQAGNETGVPARSKVAHVKYVFSRIGKLLQHTFPCYIKALLKTEATRKDWGRFISDIFQLAIGGEPACVLAADDAKTSKCAVYIPADVKHAISCYGFKKEDVFVVGNPDLLQFDLGQSMIGRWPPPGKSLQKSIMYIETGLSSVATLYPGAQGFINHLIETSNSLAAQGYKMRLKLKPNQVNTNAIIQGLADTQIELVTNKNFLQSLTECSACIAETTTLALMPALMGMPLLLARYGHLKSLAFGPVLTSYPRGYLLQDLSDVSDILLKDTQMSDNSKLNEWIGLNVGPLPPEKMPERVAAIVDEMIATAGRQKFTNTVQ